jgi:leucine dehydrogenase
VLNESWRSKLGSVDFDAHEQVVFCHDAEADLHGIIAVHSTRLGPAAGGCRMHPYESVDAALSDVLRLSRGMTYKNALAGLPLGGGKCVVIGDPSEPGKEARLRAMARQVQRLGGTYWTAIDVGVSSSDADLMAQECDFIFARASGHSDGFMPAHFTALGGFHGIRAVAHRILGRDSLEGVRVAIQGVGATGHDLARQLHEAGARLVVADVDRRAVDSVVGEFGAVAVDPAEIHAQDVDVFAPCALGGILDDASIPHITARAICGVANNQLARPEHGARLMERGIAYVPDFVVNAGGMIGAGTVIYGEPDREASLAKVRGIYDVVGEIIQRSEAEGRPTVEIAEAMAEERIFGR